MRRSIPFLCVLLVCLSETALAGGFVLYEHGAAGTGMAGARTASCDDAQALYHNPAAITELEGLQLELGVTGALANVEYQAAKDPPDRTYTRAYDGSVHEINDGQNDMNSKKKMYTPAHLYATYRIADIGLTAGFGYNNPFGMGSYWPGTFDGRFIGTETEMLTHVFQPVVAVDVAKLLGIKDRLKVSLAGGYDLVYATARLSKHIDLRVAERLSTMIEIIDPWGEMRMTGDAVGHGWNVALYAELPGLLAFGASFRSGIALDFEGSANFWFNQAGQRAIELLGTNIPEKDTGSLTVNLPMNMNFGLAFLGIDRLKVAVDFYLADFSTFKELALNFNCVKAGTCDLDQDPIPKNWGISWQISVGAEYWITDSLVVRAGYGTVSNPIPADTYDPSLPDGRRDLFTAGVGYKADRWKVNFGYMLAIWGGTKDNNVGGEDATGNPNGKANGKYTTVAHLPAISFSTWFK
jgi:long-chain fatty acid transport protein